MRRAGHAGIGGGGGDPPDYVVWANRAITGAAGAPGSVEMQVKVQGRAAHASSPGLGSNAIHNAARLIFGIELLAPRWPMTFWARAR